jgi:hypothetical protein
MGQDRQKGRPRVIGARSRRGGESARQLSRAVDSRNALQVLSQNAYKKRYMIPRQCPGNPQRVSSVCVFGRQA